MVQLHVPVSECSGNTTRHAFGVHCASVNTPRWHLVGPDRVCPASQEGTHDSPCSRTLGHAPMRPFRGGFTSRHAFGSHRDACKVPY